MPAQQTIPGATDPILLAKNPGSLAMTNHTFVGWNGAADGSGTLYAPMAPPALPTPYMQYNATSWDSAAGIMRDVSGNSRDAIIVRGTPAVATIAATAGTNKTIQVLSGGTTAGFTMPNPQLTAYTLCFVARYSGASKGRIFDANAENWLSGFWSGSASVAYHTSGWVTSSAGTADTNFHVMCDSGSTFLSDGLSKATTTSPTSYLPINLTVNNNAGVGRELSDWQIADVIVYDSALSSTNILQVEMFLREKYGITAATPAIPTYVATGATINSFFTSPNGNVTVYAQWNSLVSYDANGATSGTVPYSQNFVDSIAGTLATNSGTLAKTNYTFGGWNTAADGSGTNYAAGGSFAATGNMTLYAQWGSVITFNVNGAASGTPSQASLTVSGNAAINLATVGSMLKTGYTFLGWATTSGAVTPAYASGASYTPVGTLTLYAVWSANSYAITFNANGGTGTLGNEAIVAGTSIVLSANTFTRTGYTFAGWNTIAAGGGTAYVAAASVTLYSNLTLYAQWTAGTYQVTFGNTPGTNGCLPAGCLTVPNQTFTAGTQFTLNANAWYRTGYTFAGWSTVSGNGSAVVYANQASVTFFGNITLYTQWTADVYTITYSPNGASGAAATTSQAWTYGSAAITSFPAIGTMLKTGYTFNGWSATSAGATALTTLTPTDSQTLYAIWTPNPYVVTFNGNGSTGGSTSAQTITAGTATTLTANGFTRTGYTFTGWNTAADGTGLTSYTNSQSVTIYAAVTVYAQWAILAPAIPTISVVGGNTSATVSITSSQLTTATAGAPNSYTVTAYSGATAVGTCTVTPTATSCIITGLTNGTAYTFKAVATNTTGSATSVASAAVTPAPYT